MIARIRSYLQARRFKAALASFDQRIAEARAKHRPIRDLQAEKTAFVHACLRGAR